MDSNGRDDYSGRSIHSIGCWDGNDYGYINAGWNEVWIDDRNGDDFSSDCVSQRELRPEHDFDDADLGVYGDSYRDGKL